MPRPLVYPRTTYFSCASYLLLVFLRFLHPASYFLLPASYFLLPTSYFLLGALVLYPGAAMTDTSGESASRMIEVLPAGGRAVVFDSRALLLPTSYFLHPRSCLPGGEQ